jgi:hypothetical protein
MQAIRNSLVLCDNRLDNVFFEDKSLLKYAAFLQNKFRFYDNTLINLKNTVKRIKRENKRFRKALMTGELIKARRERRRQE